MLISKTNQKTEFGHTTKAITRTNHSHNQKKLLNKDSKMLTNLYSLTKYNKTLRDKYKEKSKKIGTNFKMSSTRNGCGRCRCWLSYENTMKLQEISEEYIDIILNQINQIIKN
jgi:hypothetical protein